MIDRNALMSTIQPVFDRGQRIQRIEIMVDSEIPVRLIAVKFEFESTCVCLAVNAMDDTITFSNDWPQRNENEVGTQLDVREIRWPMLAASTLMWAWSMQNNLGYTDGIQLEFTRDGQPSIACVQFIAVASALRVRTVQALATTVLWE